MQDKFIDILAWPHDEEFFAAYPEGARPKRALFSPAAPKESFILPNWRHMFKRSASRYPEQFWAEIIAYEISILLDVPAPPCYPAFDSSKGQCGTLSPWFYKDGDEYFYSAGNFFHKHIQDFDRERGTQHNLIDSDQFNNRVLGKDQIYSFWGMILFDAIIGNTDRHQDNWGHIVRAVKLSKSVARRRKGEEFDIKFKFAPWFDNGTSLGHELMENKFSSWDDAALDRYILRGKHHLRFSPQNLERIGHLESFSLLSALPKVRILLLRKIKAFDLSKLDQILTQCASLQAPYEGNLNLARAQFILRLTKRRLQLVLEKLNECN